MRYNSRIKLSRKFDEKWCLLKLGFAQVRGCERRNSSFYSSFKKLQEILQKIQNIDFERSEEISS